MAGAGRSPYNRAGSASTTRPRRPCPGQRPKPPTGGRGGEPRIAADTRDTFFAAPGGTSGPLAGALRRSCGAKGETRRPLVGAQTQANLRPNPSDLRLAGHWRERFQANFGNEGGVMKTTWSKRGVRRANIADKQAKGLSNDASYAGRVGVHYLHPWGGGLQGEELNRTKIMEHAGNCYVKCGIFGRKSMKARKMKGFKEKKWHKNESIMKSRRKYIFLIFIEIFK